MGFRGSCGCGQSKARILKSEVHKSIECSCPSRIIPLFSILFCELSLETRAANHGTVNPARVIRIAKLGIFEALAGNVKLEVGI